MKRLQFLPSYHPLPCLFNSLITLLCLMDQRHFHKAQRKAEAALLASMRQRQWRLETTTTALPSFNVLWRSLRLQLMGTLQKLASDRKLTLIEANEMLLQTKPQDLTMDERCWLESARNLVSLMPPPTDSEVKHYDLSSYPPKLIPRREVLGAPSTETETNITPQWLLMMATADPQSPSPAPHQPATTSTSSRVVLLLIPALIRAIFQMDLLPMPSSALPYQLATRRPLSVTPMGPPCVMPRPGSSVESPWRRPTTPHPKTGQTLCLLGLYRTKDLEELTSRSQTSKDTPNNPTTSRS